MTATLFAVLAAGATPARAQDPFIDAIESFAPGTFAGFGQDAMPEIVLGPPEGAGMLQGSFNVLSLGNDGSIAVRFDDPVICDGEGVDFTIFENAFHAGSPSGPIFREVGIVEVSQDGISYVELPYDAVTFEGLAGQTPVLSNSTNGIDPTDPAVSGGDTFDLADAGLAWAAYVRITDPGSAIADPGNVVAPGTSGGFDLDAIAIVNACIPGETTLPPASTTTVVASTTSTAPTASTTTTIATTTTLAIVTTSTTLPSPSTTSTLPTTTTLSSVTTTSLGEPSTTTLAPPSSSTTTAAPTTTSTLSADTTTTTAPDSTTTTVPAGPACGDGVVGGSEGCDDGDTQWLAGEHCTSTCALLECGDTDGNGAQTAGDALFTLRAAIGSAACDGCICNVDGGPHADSISASDALRLLRHAVGAAGSALACPMCAASAKVER
jgi:hypothetical protein